MLMCRCGSTRCCDCANELIVHIRDYHSQWLAFKSGDTSCTAIVCEQAART